MNSVTEATTMAASNVVLSHSEKLLPAAMIVYEVDPLCDPRWAMFIQRHPRASVFPDVPLTNGMVYCCVESWLTGRRLVSLPFSDHCDPLIDTSDERDCILAHLKRSVDRWKLTYAEIRPVSYQPGSHDGLGADSTYQFHCLDLRRSTQELFGNFHKDCVQRKIRRAEREGLKYEEGTSEDLLRKFYKLIMMTRRRQYLPPQPLTWFRGLIAAFGEDLKIRIASKDDLPIAGILTLSHKKSMIYKYGGSDASFHKFGGMAFLFWKAIQDAKDNGLEELDMGRSDTDNSGLVAFKQHFGATGTLLRYWTYPPRPPVAKSTWKKSLARHLVSPAPDFVLEAIGALLYKHIG
jgi:hypothetical protein